MSFLLHVTQNKGLLYVQGIGKVTGEDLKNYYHQLCRIDGVGACDKALVHLAHEDVNLTEVTLDQVRGLSNMFNASPVLPEHCKMAMVVRSRLTFGFVRLFMAMRRGHIEICPFLDMEAALAWLDLKEEDIQPYALKEHGCKSL